MSLKNWKDTLIGRERRTKENERELEEKDKEREREKGQLFLIVSWLVGKDDELS